MINEHKLRDTYSLSFSKIIETITNNYRHRFGGEIIIMIKDNKLTILRDGKVFETLRMDKLDMIFSQVEIHRLRGNLEKL